MERSGPAALEEWARNATSGYRGVNVKNMTTSWRNGLAFCAIIHRYHPELIDYNSLKDEDILGNCSLAFEVAESKLGVPALLDPEDMVAMEIPDRLSILTYVSTLYNVLRSEKKRSAVTPIGGSKKPRNADVNDGVRGMDADDIIEAARLKSKKPMLTSRTVCTACQNPVFLLERVMFAKKLYHKSCLRCANCDTVLNQHTADISPDGKLYCLDRGCQRKLQELVSPPSGKPSRQSALASDIKLWEKPKKVTSPVMNGQEEKSSTQQTETNNFKTSVESVPKSPPAKIATSINGIDDKQGEITPPTAAPFLPDNKPQEDETRKNASAVDNGAKVPKVNSLREMWEHKIKDEAGTELHSNDWKSQSFRSRTNFKAFMEDGYTAPTSVPAPEIEKIHSRSVTPVLPIEEEQKTSLAHTSPDTSREHESNGLKSVNKSADEKQVSHVITEFKLQKEITSIQKRTTPPPVEIIEKIYDIPEIQGSPPLSKEKETEISPSKKHDHLKEEILAIDGTTITNHDDRLPPNKTPREYVANRLASYKEDEKSPAFSMEGSQSPGSPTNESYKSTRRDSNKSPTSSLKDSESPASTVIEATKNAAFPAKYSSETPITSIPQVTIVVDDAVAGDTVDFAATPTDKNVLERGDDIHSNISSRSPSPAVLPTNASIQEEADGFEDRIADRSEALKIEDIKEESNNSLITAPHIKIIQPTPQKPKRLHHSHAFINSGIAETEIEVIQPVVDHSIVSEATDEEENDRLSPEASVADDAGTMNSTMKEDGTTVNPLEDNGISPEVSEDRLRIEDVDDERPRSRSVSFSAVVEVAEIKTPSSVEILEASEEKAMLSKSQDENNVNQTKDVVEPSPETKRKNTIELLRENIAAIAKREEDLNPFLMEDDDDADQEDYFDVTSRNESGVGDSLTSDAKSDTTSINLSIGDSRDKVPNGGDSEDEEKRSTVVRNVVGAQGESQEKPKPVPRTHKAQRMSVSPAVERSILPPTPKKRTSTNEIYKTQDYYPAELNPFESEDNFTLKPSDILVMKKAPSREKLTPSNPFEDDEDDEPPQPLSSPVRPVVKSADTINGSTRSRHGKSRHAPLPPSFMPSPTKSKTKAPAPPPPRVTPTSQHSSSSPTLGSGEKRVIPAPPDLLKGLTPKKPSTMRKKRRAPPPKRYVPALPEDAIKTELLDLSVQENELERQGVTLESNIRRLMDQEDPTLEEQIDEMVIQLWNIVNEKNDILRRQTELDYLRRGHRLEETQSDVEFRLRTLIETPIDQRTDDHDLLEKELLEDLLRIVDERNEVVDWLDYHRQNEQEEDVYVSSSLSSFSSLNRTQTPTPVVMPVLSDMTTDKSSSNTNLNDNKSKSKEKTKEDDGKHVKKDRFKFPFFSKKKKSKSKSQVEETIAEPVNAS